MLLTKVISAKYLLILICVLFLFTRFYKINEIPLAVYWDEASIGYNAYSLLTSGKDEWGESFPLHFRAFGEFKLPVYIYSTLFSVAIFGLDAFAVRFPAVFFSLGIIILTYLLAKKVSNNKTIALLSSFLISISPWFFIFSRTGYEATAGLMFYLMGIYLFIYFEKSRWLIIFSFLSFILSAYSYNSFRILIPLTIVLLVFLYLKDLKKIIIPLLFSLIIIGISAIPIYRNYALDNGSVRLKTIAAEPADYILNYFAHFNPIFLFVSGDTNLRSQQAGFGQFFFPQLLLFISGLIYIARNIKNKALLILLLLIAPIPAALTRESPHALRSLSFVPFFSIISAIGSIYFKRYVVIVLIFLGFFVNYFINFLNTYPQDSASDWQYEYKRIFSANSEEFLRYKRIIISDQYAQPYIFALFYLRYDPDAFRKEVIRNSPDQWGFSTVSKFGKFEFVKTREPVKFIE